LEHEGQRIEAACGRRAAPLSGARARLQEAAEDREQRALSAAGRTDDRHYLAGANGERDVVEHLERAEAVADMVGDQVHELTQIHRIVIASQRVRPSWAGPMTGSAKQSTAPQADRWIASSLRSSQ